MENLEILTLYKLIILYMLDKVDFSLTKNQLFDFMLGRDYTDYFTLQKVMNQLTDDQMIESKFKHNASHLTIFLKENGITNRDALKDFIKKGSKSYDALTELKGFNNIPIDTYLKERDMQLRNEVSISADYYRSTVGEYVAELSARERNSELLSIKISMPTEEAASEICNNWHKRNQEVYASLMELLL